MHKDRAKCPNRSRMAAGVYAAAMVIDGTSYPVTGGSTAMVASFDSKGALRWFKALPGSTMSWAHSVAATGAGRVCISGWFAGQMQAGTELLDSGAGQNGFFECFDANGAFQLAKSFGGAGNVQPKDVAIAPNGDIGVGGLYFRTMTLGADTLPETATDDAFVARFDPSGNPKHARAFGGNGEDDIVWAVAFDSQSNLIAAGTVSAGTMDFGGTQKTFSAAKNAFVAKYQPDGIVAWVQSFENGANQMLSAADVGPQDQVVIAGGFPGTVDFGGGPFTSAGDLDNGVVVLDSAGKHVASKLFGGSGTDRAQAVRFRNDKIVVAGLFQGSMEIGTTSLSAPDQNGYAVGLSADLGTVRWAHSLGGTGDDLANGVDVSASAVALAGQFAATLAFGQLSAVSAGQSDGFLLYFKP